MYAKFLKAVERRRLAQALAEENDARCLPSNPREMHENPREIHEHDSMQLEKNMPSESHSSCESGSKSSQTDINNLPKMMENSLHISKPLVGNIETDTMLLEERKPAEHTKSSPEIHHETGNGGEHMEISPSINSKMAIQTECGNASMKPLTNGSPDHKVLVESEVMTSVDTTIGTNSHDLAKLTKNSLGGPNSKIKSGKMTLMDYRRMKLAQKKMGAAKIVQMEPSTENLAESSNRPPTDLNVGEHIFQTEHSINISQHVFSTEGSETVPNRPTDGGSNSKIDSSKMTLVDFIMKLAHMDKVPVDANENGTTKHIVSTEGRKTVPERPTEMMENGMHGAKKKTGTAKMVPTDLCMGNLAESLNIQTEQKYAFFDEWVAGPDYFVDYPKLPAVVGKFKNEERHMDVSKTDVSDYDLERKRAEFNKLVQKRNPEVRSITNTLEHPLLFDILRDSVQEMNYNGGRNPVAVLNELMPGLEYHTEKIGNQHLPTFEVSVNINGQNYCGVGKTKKAAKFNTATAALKGIDNNKKTLTSGRTSIPKNIEPTYISSNWRNDPSTSTTREQERFPPGQTLNAVSVLNNLRKGVEYRFVAKNGPPHRPNFEVRVKVDQKIYRGTGGSKKLAKANAARQALMSINGETYNSQGASKPNTSNVATASANKQYVAVSVPKGKLPITVLNELYPNPEVSWTGRGSDGGMSFTIILEGRKFTGLGLNMKSAKNNAAIKALHELRGFSPTGWKIH